MTRNTTLAALIVMCLAAVALGADDQPKAGDTPQPKADMTVKATAVTGRVEVRSTPEADWKAVKVGDEFALGSQLRTGLRSSVTMNVGPNAEVEIKSLTIMMVSDLVADDANTLRTRLALKYGSLKFDVRHVGFKNDFQVATPTGVMAVKGTGGWMITFDGRPLIIGMDTNGFDAILQQFNNGDYSFLTGADKITGVFIDPVVCRDYLAAISAAAGIPSETDAAHGRLGLTNLPAEKLRQQISLINSSRATRDRIIQIIDNGAGGDH